MPALIKPKDFLTNLLAAGDRLSAARSVVRKRAGTARHLARRGGLLDSSAVSTDPTHTWLDNSGQAEVSKMSKNDIFSSVEKSGDDAVSLLGSRFIRVLSEQTKKGSMRFPREMEPMDYASNKHKARPVRDRSY